jgi:hypothetical protein
MSATEILDPVPPPAGTFPIVQGSPFGGVGIGGFSFQRITFGNVVVTYSLNGQQVGTAPGTGFVTDMATDFACGGTTANPSCHVLPGSGTNTEAVIHLPPYTYETFFGTPPPTEGVVTLPNLIGGILFEPEPSTVLLVSLGMTGLAVLRRAQGSRA